MANGVTASCSKRFSSFRLDVEVSVPDGITVLVGPSGSGKTTLLRLLAGLERPDSGEITFQGEIWDDARTHTSVQKRKIGFVFNDYALFPHLSVEQNIRFGAPNTRCVRKWLSMMGLEELKDRRPRQLSAGQQQRVALARALVGKPRLLLMDEPFSSLDPHLKDRIYEEFLELYRHKPVPTLLVTHDLREACRLGDRILVMSEGKILQAGTPREILRTPNGPEVARLVGIRNLFRSFNDADGLRWGDKTLRHDSPGEKGEVDWFVHSDRVEISDCELENSFPATIRDRTLEGAGYRLEVAVGGESLDVFAPVELAERLPAAVFVRIPPDAIQFFSSFASFALPEAKNVAAGGACGCSTGHPCGPDFPR